ncbi:MAG: hypothetical protein JW913_16075 [Chitinispirillaceae bacterium]|nr:hypothetical protein [Chitinispirillaceae bacterium]
MITDLCPIDVLLQRIGRLHRHRNRKQKERPHDYRIPKVIVLVPENRDVSVHIHSNGEARGPHGIGTVYPDLRILEATWRLLETHPTIDIPAMNRHLVETAMHKECLQRIIADSAWDRRQKDAWQRHSNYIEGIIHAQGQTAAINLVKWDKEFGEYTFGDISSKITTRLGGGDRIVDFGREIPSPFGVTFRFLTIPGHWAGGIAEDEKPEIIDECPAGIIFKIGTRVFIYDRWGLRPHKDDDPAEIDE